MTFSPRKCHKDQFHWRCKTCYNAKDLLRKNIRSNSFFEEIKLTITRVLF